MTQMPPLPTRFGPSPLGVGALLFTLLALGCEGREDKQNTARVAEAAPTARRGGTAVVMTAVDPATVNPLVASEVIGHAIGRDLLFAPLIRLDSTLQPIPWLAERWDTAAVGSDSVALSFRLRPGLRWHDGQPVTAEDVGWTFERALDPRSAYRGRAMFALYAPHAQVVDSRTIRLRLRRHPEFLVGWYDLPPLPKHLLAGTPPERLAQHPFGSTQPVGNGPFRFVRRAPGQEWVFAANPEFPQALGGRPHLDRLVIRPVPDASTRLTELLTGGADLVVPVKASDAAQLRSGAAGTRLLVSPTRNWYLIAWNTRLPPFDTPEERRALTLAIDRPQIVQAAAHGIGMPGRSVVTPAHWSFATDPANQLPFDPEAARRLLARAGWADRNQDGVVEDASGRPFRFQLLLPQGSGTLADAAQIVQAQLARIGVGVEIRQLEPQTLFEQVEGSVGRGGTRRRDFEAVLMGWEDDPRKDDSPLWHSRNRNGAEQWTGFTHPRVDHLLDSLAAARDRNVARPLWVEYQRLIAEQAPVTVLYYPRQLMGARERLHGLELNGQSLFGSAPRWWLSPTAPGAS